MSESSVKVGIRIRPLIPSEVNQQQSLHDYDITCIRFRNQTYTFDHVFGPDLSQQNLYENTAAPMLKSFLEGYNVTIIAYGQTGSGKTFTMGTSESNMDDIDNQGLIPRFVCDLFENMKQSQEDQKTDAKVKVAFLEIYGEDIYDLLGSSSASSGRMERRAEKDNKISLPIRETDQGQVFVQGQQDIEVSSPDEALGHLYAGSRNRVTGSTQMNAASSRSHAIFTVSLVQTIHSSEEDSHTVTSKLTFVDLAGSERIKRTQADGQRMKEGIQINSGLFNLGQVINGLADDQRIKNGNNKNQHIPYRNSKLTYILKDALGGNSQTLFLACVSPSSENEAETLTTLVYAKQARNIKNKPVLNMDQTQLELRRLRLAIKEWMRLALSGEFAGDAGSKSGDTSLEELLDRPEVQEFISNVNKSISSKVASGAPTPRKIRLSVAPSPFPKRKKTLQMHRVQHSPVDQLQGRAMASARTQQTQFQSELQPLARDLDGLSWTTGADEEPSGGSWTGVGALDSLDVEEPQRLLARMVEITALDKELTNIDEESINTMDLHIQEKEEILAKLVETMNSFAPLKKEYERLAERIVRLDIERKQLEVEVENAKKQSDKNPNLEKLNERFQKVKMELDQANADRYKKENAMKVMQRSQHQAEVVQKEIKRLRDDRVNLIKQSKTQVQKFQTIQKEQTQKVCQLKRSDTKKQQLLNTLKRDLDSKDRILVLKVKELARLRSKLKAAEVHIKALIKNQTKSRWRAQDENRWKTNYGKQDEKDRKNNKFGLSNDELKRFEATKAVLDNMVEDRLEEKALRVQYAQKMEQLDRLNQEIITETSELESLLTRRCTLAQQESDNLESVDVMGELSEEFDDVLRSIAEVETTLEITSREAEILRMDLDDISARLSQYTQAQTQGSDGNNAFSELEAAAMEIVSDLDSGICQHVVTSLLLEKIAIIDALKSSELSLSNLKNSVEASAGKVHELEQRLQDVQTDCEDKVFEAEKQRIEDVWAVLKGKTFPAENDVSFRRAQELERELEYRIGTEAQLTIQLNGCLSQLAESQKKVQELEIKTILLESSSLIAANNKYEIDAPAKESSPVSQCQPSPMSHYQPSPSPSPSPGRSFGPRPLSSLAPLSSYNCNQLRSFLRDRGMPCQGNKSDLINRLRQGQKEETRKRSRADSENIPYNYTGYVLTASDK